MRTAVHDTEPRTTETPQLRAELFRQMSPMLDSDEMLRKMIAYLKTLLAAQLQEQEAVQEKGYKTRAVAPDIERWSGCATFTQEEIDADPRKKAILER